MLQSVLGGFSPDIAVDFGSANTLVYAKGRGIVANEPTFVAVHEAGPHGGKIAAMGSKAKELCGKTSEKIKTASPLREGVIHDFELAHSLLKYCVDKTPKRRPLIKSKVIVAIAPEATPVEERALIEAAQIATHGEIYLIQEPIAAALGAGLPVTEAMGSMICDLGAATTTVSVLSLGGIVRSESIKTAGNAFDRKIIEYVRKAHQAIIGDQTAEDLKIRIGAALASKKNPTLTVQGRDIKSGLPANISLSQSEIVSALADSLSEIARLVSRVLERTPPEMASDVVDRGIYLVGGSSKLRDIDLFLQGRVKVPIALVEDPHDAGITGAGAVLEQWDALQHLLARG